MDVRKVTVLSRTVMALIAVSLATSGCISLKFGVSPHTERLEQLTPGVSTASDVLLGLGEPRGKGAAHLSPDLPARDIWLYEYTTAKGDNINLKMLVVFMNGDVYDGYLWFSSMDKLQKSYR